MSSDTYDLLIVGGGINGAGIARDASGRGLKVLLCEQSDLASATSSASSKLIHGGLRYLELYEFRLVREALAEREVLLRAAPHIIRPLRFVLPHNKILRPAWMIRLGLFLYDHLGGKRSLPGTVGFDLRREPEGAPLKDRMTKGFAYSDCWVEDSRLVVLNAIDAQARGADILVRTRCVSARREEDQWRATLRDETTGAEREVTAKILVNAAGPWVDSFLKNVAGRDCKASLKLVKGSHIIVPRLYEGEHAYILQNADRRVIFAIPYEDFTLIGTTDIVYEGDPGKVAISEEEIRYLCDAVGRYFDKPVSPDEIVSSYSGVRPLYDDRQDNPSAVTRDYVFDVEAPGGDAPLLSIYGGKITTYRKLAEHALEKLSPHLPALKPAWTAAEPLPGGDVPDRDIDRFLAGLRSAFPCLPEDLAKRYCRLYGTLCHRFLDGVVSMDDLGIHFGASLYEREVRYLVDHEWARTAEDVLWRRTRLGLTMPEEGRVRLEAWLAGRFSDSAAGYGMSKASA
ncbi:glycerol-3-phosphate dehydrogenase [Inquilinus sp. CAU 1745]|uniref:glycerol-3-phosphate dehydrogenase n=1 Tax=Inquilinus sp. CAU 1745 TaxID=3140369 RepID=UPI00325BA973